jgi:hypothetical protein
VNAGTARAWLPWLVAGLSSGCSLVLDVDGYGVASADAGIESLDPNARPAGANASSGAIEPVSWAAFQDYRFPRGAPSFVVSADSGLLSTGMREEAPSGQLVTGSFVTARGGGVELTADGGFSYTPQGGPSTFWGDDSFDYQFQGSAKTSHVRLTVYPDHLSLDELAQSGGAGFGLGGAAPLDGIGRLQGTFAPAGDVNGDGLQDFLIALLGDVQTEDDYYYFNEGRSVYVLFGKRDATDVSLAAPAAGAGFFVRGDGNAETYDSWGGALAPAGDVNGDGLDDFIVGQYARTDPGATGRNGAAFVVFGKADTEDVASESLLSGAGNGFVIQGGVDDHGVGYSVSGAGDFNGDGLSDLILSVPTLNRSSPDDLTQPPSGAFVVFGKVDHAPVRLADIAAGIGGFALIADTPGEYWGFRAVGVGDVNGDGLDDIGLGLANPEATDPGHIWIVFGQRNPAPTLSPADIEADPALGFAIDAARPRDSAEAVGRVGDVDGDGIDDLVLRAPYATVGGPAREQPVSADVPGVDAGASPVDAGTSGAEPGAMGTADTAPLKGAVYVLFGRSGAASRVGLIDLEQGAATGFSINGPAPNAYAGSSTSAGDLDGDGISDLVVSTLSSATAGQAFVIFGGPERTSIDLAAPPPGRVFSISGSGYTCDQTISGSDFNGDGLDDLLVSAVIYPNAPQAAGGAYVAFSWDMRGSLAGRAQPLIGTAGNDVFDLPILSTVVVRGGNGTDTLRAGSETPLVDLRPLGRYQSIEVIDVRGGGPHRVLLDDAALRHIPQNQQGFAYSLARRLTVLGDAEDTLEFDMTGFRARGGSAGRVVYGKDGVYYGLEVSQEMTIAPPTSHDP